MSCNPDRVVVMVSCSDASAFSKLISVCVSGAQRVSTMRASELLVNSPLNIYPDAHIFVISEAGIAAGSFTLYHPDDVYIFHDLVFLVSVAWVCVSQPMYGSVIEGIGNIANIDLQNVCWSSFSAAHVVDASILSDAVGAGIVFSICCW